MSIIKIKELSTDDKNGLIEKLKMQEDDFNYLLVKNIIKPRSNGLFSIVFVGLIVFENHIVQVEPKFSKLNMLKITDILAILETYFANLKKKSLISDFDTISNFTNRDIFTELDLFLELRDWTIEYGLYKKRKVITKDRGQINWGRTLAKKSPIITNGSVLYPETITKQKIFHYNEISSIQMTIIEFLTEKYDYSLLSIDKSQIVNSDSNYTITDILETKTTYIRNKILSALSVTFDNKNLTLLNLILSFIDKNRRIKDTKPVIYGTTAFYAVWEDACRNIFTNETLDNPISYLNLPVIQFNDTDRQDELLNLIPDLILQNQTHSIIADAKYYYPFPYEKPQASDIIKQIMYAELANFTNTIISIFLMPIEKIPESHEIMRFLGQIKTSNNLKNRSFSTIFILGLDPYYVLKIYTQTQNHIKLSLMDVNLLITTNEVEMTI